MQLELVRKVKDLYYADVLRADRSTAAHGLEVRVPFLDLEFLDLVMSINPKQKLFDYQPANPSHKVILEKYILRDAFSTPDCLLSEELIWSM